MSNKEGQGLITKKREREDRDGNREEGKEDYFIGHKMMPSAKGNIMISTVA